MTVRTIRIKCNNMGCTGESIVNIENKGKHQGLKYCPVCGSKAMSLGESNQFPMLLECKNSKCMRPSIMQNTSSGWTVVRKLYCVHCGGIITGWKWSMDSILNPNR